LAAVLFGFSLLFQPCAVFADAIPYAANIGYSGWSIEGDYIADPTADIYPTQDALCQRAMLLRTGFPSAATYTYFTYTVRPVRGDCWYSHPILITGRIIDGWARELACPRGGLPEDRMAEVPMCSCPPGQKFPPSVVWWKGPWCIPDTTPSCPIDPIPEFTPDPYPALIDELSPRMQTALSCLRAAIGGQGGSSDFESGYRPALYNAHLQAVFDQQGKLDQYPGPECDARRAELAIEKRRHKIKERPADNSLHIIREAFDLVSTLNRQVTNGLAIDCNAFAPLPIRDRNHFEHTR
jgi:hypothetical protein